MATIYDYGSPTDTRNAPSYSAWAQAVAAAIPQIVAGSIPIGTISHCTTDTAPAAWMFCQGQSLSATEYPDLFAVVAYAYGGSGDNFSLPDLRGRTAVGVDTSQSEFATLAQQGGEKSHVLSAGEMFSHTHTQNAHNHSPSAHGHVTKSATTNGDYWGRGNGGQGGWSVAYNDGGNNNIYRSGINAATITMNTVVATNQAAGIGIGHNNMQPYLVMHAIIKVS